MFVQKSDNILTFLLLKYEIKQYFAKKTRPGAFASGLVVPSLGIEPRTRKFSVCCSTN